MANGKICTGFSKPWVAVYGSTGYTGGIPLARGVEVSIEPETSDDNDFYADNMLAESASGVFNGGTVTLTVDGLKTAAEKLIAGLADPTTITVGSASVDVYHYGDGQTVPYCGVGFIARYQEEGVVTYAPIVLTKVKFNAPNTTAATQAEEIDWQTQELTATLMRDGNKDWKLVAADQDDEATAETVLKKMLGVTA